MPIRSDIDEHGIATVIMDNPPVNALTVAGWFELDRHPRPEPPTPLADRLLMALAAVPADPARIEVARQRVARLAERVLGAKDRPAYEIVAAIVGLLAQTTASVDGGERRFSAFRGELRDARAAAGLLAP